MVASWPVLLVLLLACSPPLPSLALQLGDARHVPGSDGITDCEDKVASCRRWADSGECHNNPFYMTASCPRSCLPHCSSKARSAGPYAGYATEAGTRSFAVAGLGVGTADGHLRRDPSMGDYYSPGQKLRGDPWLHISSLGVGTQLGKEDATTDRLILSAILKSVASGWNVIDTAVSYRGGRSETIIGVALSCLISVGSLSREMLFIGTKAGVFSEASDFREHLQAVGELPSGALVDGHCIHPACLEASLATSLSRMRLDTVDVLYLHFPAENQLQKLGRQAFLERLSESFTYLEEQRASGRIRAYGLATWDCFRTPPTSEAHLSLAEVVDIARKVGGGANHGFRYIQVPVNVNMPEAWEQRWQRHGSDWWTGGDGDGNEQGTLLEVAARLGVGVFGVSPLQTAHDGSEAEAELLRSVRSVMGLAGLHSDVGKLLQMARSAPLLLSCIVGHSTESHVVDNVKLSWERPLPPPKFRTAWRQLINGDSFEELK